MADNVNSFNRDLIDEFRTNGGRVTGPFAGAPLLLLTTTGAKSGQPRVSPLVFTRDGDHLVVAASKGGAPSNPDWFRNVSANPEVTVELPGETFAARATVPDRTVRDQLYAAHAEAMPGFADYEAKTDRIIPIVVLERVS